MSSYSYRTGGRADLPSLLHLWEQAGWGTLTPEQWTNWYERGPCGPSIVSLARDEERVFGQLVLSPSRLVVDGREVDAMRISAPILDRQDRIARGVTADHPIIGLTRAATLEACERGVAVLYAQPDASWLSFVERTNRLNDPLLTYDARKIACVGRSLDGVEPRVAQLAEACTVERITAFDERHEALWRRACVEWPIACGIVRSKEWLQYRNGGHLALEVRDVAAQRLLGYAVIRRDTMLLHDVLTATPADMEFVLAAIVGWLVGPDGRDVGSHAAGAPMLKAMDVVMLHDVLARLGFRPIDFAFAFMCIALDATLAPAIAPERWFMMPAD